MKLVIDSKRLAHFWDKVQVSAGNCWLWDGHTTSDKGYQNQSYGQFWTGREKVAAHRFSYFLFYDQLPSQLYHTCNNKLCVNPHHLSPNPKYRQARVIEYHKRKMISGNLIKKILKMRKRGLTQREISHKLGYHQGRISQICSMYNVVQRAL